MSASVRWVADGRRSGTKPQGRVRRALTGLATFVLGLVILAIVGLALRGGPGPTRPTFLGLTVGAANATPDQLTGSAANVLDEATAASGGGYGFEIVQTSTMVAKTGGPRIPIPADTGRGTKELADRYFLHSILETGVVRPDGFWSQMRAGPEEGKTPDWTGSRIMFEALVRDGQRFRNDGHGWYKADALPGIGLDPATASLLPALLRGATGAKDVASGDPKADPTAARTLEASAKPAAIPGVVAADGVSFTKLTAPLAYGFDDSGRLISVNVTALNTNMTDFDLVIETTISITYDGVAGLPAPTPALDVKGSN